MKDSESQIPISVDISAKAELSGEVSTESLDNVFSALLDIFSPVSHGLGLLGDHLHSIRTKLAIKQLAHAKELAEKHNIQVKPVPAKVLVPYIEAVSLEDDLSGELKDMWSSILLKSNDFNGADTVHFIDLMKKISKDRAIALQKVFEYEIDNGFNSLSDILQNIEWRTKHYTKIDPRYSKILNIEDIYKNWPRNPFLPDEFIDNVSKHISEWWLKHLPISSIFLGFCCNPRENSESKYDYSISYAVDLSDYSFLENLRLLDLVEHESIFEVQEGDLHIRYWVPHLTTLGARFLFACNIKGDNTSRD